MTDLPQFNFDNSYARDLEGFYVPWEGDVAPDAQVLRLNADLASELGLDAAMLGKPDGAKVLTGAVAPDGARPLAMAYAGHQFGGFSPQLGDGRAILIGEVIDRDGHRRDIHLKGSGRTPFSRGGDGKAVLGPVLREYLMGEAMHALGVPTTRALAASTTGEKIMRDGYEAGAVLARVASSHLRVGTFQFFAARGDTEKLAQLANYAIARHDPDLIKDPDRYFKFFERVRDRQARLIAQWMGIGFIHGVMNTDNMTISGETIDYGPCAFMDIYDPKTVFSSIDQHGRYAYGNQPGIAQWNLARLAETLVPLIAPEDADAAVTRLTDALEHFANAYQDAWLSVMRAKLGLAHPDDGDRDLAAGFLGAMDGQMADFTQSFRALSHVIRGDAAPLRALFVDPSATLDPWLEEYLARIDTDPGDANDRADAMDRINPVYIPRNHKVEEALSAARDGDMSAFDALLGVLARPFEEQDGMAEYARPAPESFGAYTTFCGT